MFLTTSYKQTSFNTKITLALIKKKKEIYNVFIIIAIIC